MAANSNHFMLWFLSPALVLSALFFTSLQADAGCPGDPCHNDMILISMSPGCAEKDLLEKAAVSATAAETLAPLFRPLYGHPGRPETHGDIEAAKAGLEKAWRLFYRLEYDEAETLAADLTEHLNRSSFPSDKLYSRWKLTEAAMALSALVFLGKGDTARYDRAVLDLALTRPGATFDLNYPPQFRKAFDTARKKAASLPGRKIKVTSTIGKWMVFVDGVARGNSPTELEVAPGKRIVEYLAPDGRTKPAIAATSVDGTKYVIDPFLTEISYSNGAAIVCLPEGQRVTSSDVSAAVAYYKSARGMALVPVPAGISMMLVTAADRPAPRLLMLSRQEAASDKKVKQSVAEMIGPEDGNDFIALPSPEVAKDEKAWYKQWWFWTVAGGVAAAAIGLPLYFCLDSGGKSGTLGSITLTP